MTLNLFHRADASTIRCPANVGNGVPCLRQTHGEAFCDFHRTLAGPYLRAATRRAV